MERNSYSMHNFYGPDALHISLWKYFSKQVAKLGKIDPILKREKLKLKRF